ncbi:MAG: hypothetical protein ACODAU_03380 [Myxococcota bacterium]
MRASLMIASASLALSSGVATPPAGVQAQGRHGRVDCELQENGSPASGTMVVHRGSRQVTTGSCGTPVRLSAGRYRVTVRLDGALDRPEQHRTVHVRPGRSERVTVDFPTGTLRIRVRSNGRRAAGMAIIYRDGDRIGTLGSGVAGHLSTGTYEVVVRHRARERRFEDVTLRAGQERTLDVDF